MLPDVALVERVAAQGDKAAFSELCGRHGMSLYAIAYTVLSDPEAADAAVAAAFREALASAGSFNAREGSVRHWLADLTRRAAHRCAGGSFSLRRVPLRVA